MALSVVAVSLKKLLMVGGVGLVLKGLWGTSQWTTFSFGMENPVSDVVTGAVMFLLGALVAYETRYTIIKHPRPPRPFGRRPV
jgi:hypothetical protein